MWKLFRLRPRVGTAISDYYKRRGRELKQNPQRFEEEQERARLWAIRTAEKNRLKGNERGRKKEERV